MSTVAYQIDLRRKLREQLQHLANSCASYDLGHKSEAIRIATVVRVLVHDTTSSTSLLSHLNAKGILLLSTVIGKPDPAMKYFHGMGMARQHRDGQRELIPSFALPLSTLIPADTWWNETVFVLEAGEVLTRKSIVLAAANQDGGTHVDLNINSGYRALATDGAAGTYMHDTGAGYVLRYASDAHLVALRQMGFELLNSSDLDRLGT
jgi:hypothetical protein